MLIKIATVIFLACIVFSAYPSTAAVAARPNVAYTGVYLMGDKQAESGFPIYRRAKDQLRDELRVTMKKIDARNQLPFAMLFDSNIEEIKQRIDNTLSLAFLVVRDDITPESFSAAGVSINKTIVNVGLVAILYDTRKIEGQDRNTVIASFPLVGYAQRLDGETPLSESDINALFVKVAVQVVEKHLSARLATVAIEEITGSITDISGQQTTISVGALNGLEEGQNIKFMAEGAQLAVGPIVKLDRQSAVVELPKEFSAKIGMHVQGVNMRAISDETFQVVDARVSSKKAARLFPPELIGPQAAQWFSNFLTDRSGKVVQPSRVGGAWDERATATAFTILDRAGLEHQFELPKPKYAVMLDITGLSSKVAESNNVNDIVMFKAWMKLKIPAKQYEQEFEIVSSKSLIKGVQSFEEKNELFDLLYQLTAKMAKEARI